MKCFLKNRWQFIAIGVVLMALVEIIAAISFPMVRDVQQENPVVTLCVDQAKTVNYEEEDGVFTPIGADPQMHFENVDKALSNFIIRLEEPTEKNVQYALYYPEEDGSF